MRTKILSLMFFATLGVITTHAQYNYLDDTRTFYGALTAGASFTQVDGDNYYGYKKPGFSAGAGVYMRVWENLAASMEILYSQKGAHGTQVLRSTNNAFQINRYDVNLNYAEVPFHLWYFDKHNHHFGAGLSYSQLINQSESATTDPQQSIQFDKYPFNKYDLNFVLTGNVRIWKGFFAGLRFNYSMLPVRKDPNIPPGFGRAEQYNNIITFKFTYLFMGGTGGSAY